MASLFGYKAWANAELFGLLAEIDVAQHAARVHQALRVLNHVYVVDCIFQAHLQGHPHNFAATNTPETPSVLALWDGVQRLDAWYVSQVAGLSSDALHQQLAFRFTDGDPGLMTREEMLLHVVTHGGYHRGAAGEILRAAGVAPPRDLYTRFLHSSEPQRRG